MYWKCSARFNWSTVGLAVEIFYDTIVKQFVIYIRVLGLVLELDIFMVRSRLGGR